MDTTFQVSVDEDACRRFEAARRAGRPEAAEAVAREKAAAVRDARRPPEAQMSLSNIPLAHREWLAGKVGRAAVLLRECPPALRGWEWRHLERLANASRPPLRLHVPNRTAVAYSPDGDRLAAGVYPVGGVLVWDA